MSTNFDENFYADLWKEELAQQAAEQKERQRIALEGPELEDDGKEEREVFYRESHYYPAEGPY